VDDDDRMSGWDWVVFWVLGVPLVGAALLAFIAITVKLIGVLSS
jgi:hypothetical protein